MMRSIVMRSTIALAAALILVALPASAQQANPPPAGDAARGKQIFNADGCYQCHGYAGQGSRSSGPRLAREELPFDAFKTQLRQPSNEMPPYAESVVSDHDAADMYAFLRSLPPPPAASSIPMLAH
jgi:mono/diheme cytochrome c family protein